jgi:dTMP kinase
MAAGRLITIEGLDGAGKSTLVAALAQELQRRGLPVLVLREPGGVPVSERIRQLVKDPSAHVNPRTEALLYAAARAQLVSERLLPALENGKLVLLDRFLDSSLAYQGAGRALGVEQVREINLFATGGLTPDRTLLLAISPAAGRARQEGRGQEPDRLELEDAAFFTAVADAYDQLARQEPDRIRTIDATRAPAEVLAQALAALAGLIPSG